MQSILDEMRKDGVGRAEMESALASMPLMSNAFEFVTAVSKSGAVQRILSDANTWFINHILEVKGLSNCFDRVVSNWGRWELGGIADQSRFVLSPATPGHGCQLCPPNLCKGRVLDEWMNEKEWARIIYVGDGRGDLCPAMRLLQNSRASTCVHARENWPLHTELETRQLASDPRVTLWTDRSGPSFDLPTET